MIISIAPMNMSEQLCYWFREASEYKDVQEDNTVANNILLTLVLDFMH